MKNEVKDLIFQVKDFMKRNAVLMLSLKAVKVLVVLFLFSCNSPSQENKGTVDTVKFDDTSLPGDTAIYKDAEETEGDEDDDDANPISPQES